VRRPIRNQKSPPTGRPEGPLMFKNFNPSFLKRDKPSFTKFEESPEKGAKPEQQQIKLI